MPLSLTLRTGKESYPTLTTWKNRDWAASDRNLSLTAENWTASAEAEEGVCL